LTCPSPAYEGEVAVVEEEMVEGEVVKEVSG